MDPGAPPALRVSRRLPRTRGDGPRSGWPTLRCPTAPPHTRGWTPLAEATTVDPVGSPAHAGMDPALDEDEAEDGRLPRTRGDGPSTMSSWGPTPPAPPHTRGWTPEPGDEGSAKPGSPAHAGMDPMTSSAVCRARRLPRTRGDGPAHTWTQIGRHRAPPHTRGWTWACTRHRGMGRGSPAHAGMDPGRTDGEDGYGRLPRTRGDGPRRRVPSMLAKEAPPHTRGWT